MKAIAKFWLTLIAVALVALVPVACGVKDEVRKLPVDTTLPKAAQEAQVLIREGHLKIAATAATFGAHKAAGLIAPAEAEKLFDRLDELRDGLVEARRMLKAGNVLEGLDKAKLQERLLVELTEYVAREVAKSQGAK